MEEQNKSFFQLLDKKFAFLFGLIGGILVVCTIGFFVLLAYVLGGGTSFGSKSTVSTNGEVEGPKKFSECLNTGKTAPIISADEQIGTSIGVGGTPATFVNGYLVSGALPYEAMKDVIDDVLAGRKAFIDNYKAYGMDSGDLEKVNMPELPDAIWRGNENAKVSIVEFSDFECPYCARFEPTIEQVVTSYGDKVRFTYRHFPLSFHTNAQKAGEAYECAKAQGKGWEMHDKLFELSTNGQLGISNYMKAATELGLK